MFEARVSGVVFESDPQSCERAFVVEPGGLTGWYEPVGTKGETVARISQHGSFDLPVFRSERFITVKGAVLAGTESELVNLGVQLSGILAEGESAPFRVQDPRGALWVRVRLSGDPKFTPHPDGLEADFQISFKAPDPRKYGVTSEFTGTSVKVYHSGNFSAAPSVLVDGPRSAPYSVSGPEGRMITVTQALSSGQQHRIDFASGGLYLNGVRQQGKLLRFQPWSIPKGRPVLMSIDQGSMTVTVTDTYI